jgi:hypothetical protein
MNGFEELSLERESHLGPLLAQDYLGKFSWFNHPGKSAAKAAMVQGVWLLLELVSELGVVHVILFCRCAECKRHGATEASSEISKESQGGQEMCDRVRIITDGP